MGKKYIIEIPDDKIQDFVGSTHFLMPYMMAGHIGHHDTGLPIEPYTEPDLEQVREEAYSNGYDDGYSGGRDTGLADAWAAAKKIALMDTETSENVTGYFGLFRIMENLTPMQAIEKIRQYEQEKDAEIKVGDEVITDAGKAVVIGVGPVHFEFVYADGSTGYDKVENVKKTGRHFPEIAEVLAKMKEADNG